MKRNIPYVVAATLLAFSMLLMSGAFAAQSPQIPIAGSTIPQFMQELPTLSVNTQSIPNIDTILGNTALTINMCEKRRGRWPRS